MDSESQPSLKPSPEIRPAQFSLATIFVVTAAVAVVLALMFVFSNWLAGPMIFFLMLAIPGVLIVAAKYGPDSWTAFCIGALVPTGVCLIGLAFTMIYFVERVGRLVSGGSPSALMDPLSAYRELLAGTVELGIMLRPIAITSWAVGIVIGILCVNTRRFILRRQ